MERDVFKNEIKLKENEWKAERDVLKSERDTFKVERDIIKAERDIFKADRNVLKTERDNLLLENCRLKRMLTTQCDSNVFRFIAKARGRQRASHGPKHSDAGIPHVFPKPVSIVGDTLHAKVGSRLDAFLNRPTTSTTSRTRPPVACNA
ncbi:hypothetical protein TNCV_5024641 [Trichonephila clavipes]|nr:hypothetical protein TNCV_5024641 [Trichonephila clavipes]